MNDKVRRLFSQLKNKWGWLLVGIAGIALLTAGSVFGTAPTDTAVTQSEQPSLSSAEQYRTTLEKQVCELLSDVDGVGHVSVRITLSQGENYVYNGKTPVRCDPPKVCGVAVVCDGGGDDHVRKEVTDLLTAWFGIGSHRIHVSRRK